MTGADFQRGRASVLINNHNYGRYLSEAIESALDQTYAPLEVVVVDDGSTDDSRDVMAAYAGAITAVLRESSHGQHAAINAGLAASSGEFLFLLDSDDVFLPAKIEYVVALFERHSEAGACFHSRDFLTRGGISTGPALELEGPHDLRDEFRAGRVPFISTTTSAICFRRRTLDLLVPLPELPADYFGDHFLKWGTLATAPVVFDRQPLSLQRLHDRNLYTRQRHWREVVQKESANALWLRRRIPGAKPFSQRLVVQVVARQLRHAERPRASPDVALYLQEVGRLEAAALLARAIIRGLLELARAVRRRLSAPEPRPLVG